MSPKKLVDIRPVSCCDKTLVLKDGVKLVSRVWYPNEGGPWPALLMRQPYGRAIASTVTYLHPEWWASNGYLVVVQDVRGQGDSEGSFQGFIQEASDTSETHSWVRSIPECNGRLGTYGFSYQGLTQLLAEPGSIPPDCLAPAMTGLDEHSHWSCDGGAYWWHLGLSWGLQLACLKAKRQKNWDDWEKIRRSLEDESFLSVGPDLLRSYDPEGMAFKWLHSSNQRESDWLIHQPLKTWLAKPMLLIGGWWDPHLKGVLDIYKRSISAGGNPELHIGPASHLHWWENVQRLHLNFFNYHLKNSLSKKEKQFPKHIVWNVTTKKWYQFEPNQTKAKENGWKLISSGSACLETNNGLLADSQPGKGTVVLVHDPWRPVPSKGGHLGPSPGLIDRSSIDSRSDVVTFTTDPLKKSITLEGIPILNLKVSADKEGFDICVALSKVSPDKKNSTQISTGFLRVLGTEALENLQREVILQPIYLDLSAKEHLRLSIAGSAWPAIGINPGSALHPCGAPSAHCEIVTIRMQLEDSKLHLESLISSKDLQEALL